MNELMSEEDLKLSQFPNPRIVMMDRRIVISSIMTPKGDTVNLLLKEDHTLNLFPPFLGLLDSSKLDRTYG